MIKEDCEKLILKPNTIFGKNSNIEGQYLLPIPANEILPPANPISYSLFNHLLYVPSDTCKGNVEQILHADFFNEFEYSLVGKILIPRKIAIISELEHAPYKPREEKILCFTADEPEMDWD